MEQSATGWLEPCKEFLETAHNAGKLLDEENLEAQREFCQDIGSNFRLAAKTPRDHMWTLYQQIRTFFQDNFYRKNEQDAGNKI